MSTFPHISQNPRLPTFHRTPGRDVTRAGGESYCNVININFPVAAQA
jgi:hypothetical protein